jgi:hypothetical protein
MANICEKVEKRQVTVTETVTVHVPESELIMDGSYINFQEYKNNQYILYSSYETMEDIRNQPVNEEVDRDFIHHDCLGEVDDHWKDKYYTKIRPQDISYSEAYVISAKRLADHESGAAPLTAKELVAALTVRMCVNLRPRKKPRQVRKKIKKNNLLYYNFLS